MSFENIRDEVLPCSLLFKDRGRDGDERMGRKKTMESHVQQPLSPKTEDAEAASAPLQKELFSECILVILARPEQTEATEYSA